MAKVIYIGGTPVPYPWTWLNRTQAHAEEVNSTDETDLGFPFVWPQDADDAGSTANLVSFLAEDKRVVISNRIAVARITDDGANVYREGAWQMIKGSFNFVDQFDDEINPQFAIAGDPDGGLAVTVFHSGDPLDDIELYAVSIEASASTLSVGGVHSIKSQTFGADFPGNPNLLCKLNNGQFLMASPGFSGSWWLMTVDNAFAGEWRRDTEDGTQGSGQPTILGTNGTIGNNIVAMYPYDTSNCVVVGQEISGGGAGLLMNVVSTGSHIDPVGNPIYISTDLDIGTSLEVPQIYVLPNGNIVLQSLQKICVYSFDGSDFTLETSYDINITIGDTVPNTNRGINRTFLAQYDSDNDIQTVVRIYSAANFSPRGPAPLQAFEITVDSVTDENNTNNEIESARSAITVSTERQYLIMQKVTNNKAYIFYPITGTASPGGGILTELYGFMIKK